MSRPLLACLLLLTCSAFLAVTSAQDEGQQVRNEELVDTDYRFQIVRPDRTWKLLPEREARKLVPDAVGGLLKQPEIHELRQGSLGAPALSDDTLAGQPCRKRSWSTRKEEIAIFTFLRDRTHFAYFVSATTAEELEAAKARFRLLP